MSDGRIQYTFLWFIENFSYCWHKLGEALYSPYFTADEMERTSWWMCVYPRGLKDEDKGYISLFVGRSKEDDGPKNISLNYELSILAADGSLSHSEVETDSFVKQCGRGWSNFMKLENISQDNLTVRCRIWKGEGTVLKGSPICARTHISVENITFLHMVENFSTLKWHQKKTVEIQSNSKKGCVVSSSVHFINDPGCEGAIIVEIASSDSNRVLCKRKVSLIDISGNIIGRGEKDNKFDAERKDIQILPLSLKRQMILNMKSEYLPDDKLFLFCECVFSIRQEFEANQHGILTADGKQANNLEPSRKDENTVVKASANPGALEDIRALYMDQCLVDVELKTKTKSFQTHKIVLCARSPVFKAMFTYDMKEKHKNCIQVDDLEDEIVQQMLLFLYSDNIENLQWNAATKLFYAGDKYQIGKLKEICSSFLIKNLTTTNAGELLVLADTHSDSGLKKSVEEFILEHEKKVFSSKEWEMLMETNPLLAMTTMHLKYK